MENNNFTIIEDQSPYFIRFKFQGIENNINRLKNIFKQITYVSEREFIHFKMTKASGEIILSELPFQQINLNPDRVSFFITKPGYYYRAHKDGINHRFSINLPVQVLDDTCETRWYSDEDLKDYKISCLGGTSRECIDFNKLNHIPIKRMVATEGECILFNTDIYHDFDNSNSKNLRVVLTLRHIDPGNFYFDDVKKVLFNI